MVTKFFKEFSGNRTAFEQAGLNTTYANNIVFLTDEANHGAGACIYARGCYFGNFAELIAALTYIKNIKVGENTYSAQGGATLEFAASTPSVVTLDVQGGKVTIGLTPTFVQSVNDVIAEVATIKGDYLKAEDRTALEGLIATAKAEAKSEVIGKSGDASSVDTLYGVRKYVDEKTADIASNSEFSTLKGRVDTIEGDYLKNADKEALQGNINTEKGRIDAIVADYLKAEDKNELVGAIATAKGEAIADSKVTMETPETPDSGYLKTYVFKQNNVEFGRVNLPKDIVVSKGELAEHEGVKCIDLTLTSGDIIHIPVSDLVDVYTGSEFVNISDANVISVDKDGIIAGLATDANAQGYASAAQTAAINHADTELAKKADKETTYTKTEVDGLVSPKANKSYVDEELAKKANAGDSYLKSETYTKSEVNALVEPKADKSYVDETFATKAQTYTKAEVEAMFDSAFTWEKIG